MTAYDVAVLVCTYRRPGPLAILLHALAGQRSTGLNTVVLVVDNSPDLEAEGVVRAAATAGQDVRYVPHGAGNISSGRNATLDHSAALAPLLALIDDDEVPEPDWLERLVAAQRIRNADVVTGPVLATYPPQTASWMKADVLYSVVGPEVLTEVSEAVCGNALITRECVRRLGLRFEESLGVSGGEDQVFFRTAQAGGARLWFTPDAVVRETVPTERLSIRYLLRREYRKGTTLGLLDRGRPGWPAGNKQRRLAAAGWWLFSGAAAALLATGQRDRTALLVGVLRVARAGGMVTGLTGRTYAHYAARPPVRLAGGNERG